ncbi:MAG TPA: hypothetical protein VF989_00150 [Polyangiaceae bacterium]
MTRRLLSFLARWKAGGTEQRVTRVGLVACCALYLGFALLHTYMLKPYRPGDEQRHTKYAYAIGAKGRLPKLRETRAANHPPAYYALVAAVSPQGKQRGYVLPGRLVSVCFGLVAVAYAFFLLRRLLPNHPAVAVSGTALIAFMPTYANNPAVLGNDAMSIAAAFALAYSSVSIVLSGPSLGRCVHVGVWMCLGALARVSAAGLLPATLVGVAAGVYLHSGGTPRRRAALAALIGVALVGAVAASSGWFYFRNQEKLGDFSGTDAILDIKRYNPVRSLTEVIFSWKMWKYMYNETWGKFSGMIRIKGTLRQFVWVLTDASLLGAAAALFRTRVWRELRTPFRPRVIAWAILALFYASVIVPALHYHAQGGGMHQRYFFGALYAPALVLALGVTWSKSRFVGLLGTCSFFLLALSCHLTYAAILAGEIRDFPVTAALQAAGAPHVAALSMLILILWVLGFAGMVYAVAVLHRPLKLVEASRG